MYLAGEGIPQNDSKAAYWFKQAAKPAHADHKTPWLTFIYMAEVSVGTGSRLMPGIALQQKMK